MPTRSELRIAFVSLITPIAASLAPFPIPTQLAIIRRHDRPDSAYVALATHYPSVAHLNLPTPTGASDGEGTLIDPRWVLTAAHVAVEVGKGHDITIGGETYLSDTVIIHPKYEVGGANDLALVRLERQVKHVEPTPVYTGEEEVGRVLTIVGYGDNGTGLTGPVANDHQVRAATNRIDEADLEWLKFLFDPPDSPNATPLEGVAGPGDSGGPGFIEIDGNRFLAGVASGQNTRATDGHRGRYNVTEYYVRVSSYVGWIEGTIKENQ